MTPIVLAIIVLLASVAGMFVGSSEWAKEQSFGPLLIIIASMTFILVAGFLLNILIGATYF